MGDQAPQRLRLGYDVSDLLGPQGSRKIANAGDPNARVQRWLEYLTAFGCTLGYENGAQMVMLTFSPGCHRR